MKESKKQWLLTELRKAGFSQSEAEQYLRYNSMYPYESLVRKWRKQASEEQKNREAEEDFRQQYSPYTKSMFAP